MSLTPEALARIQIDQQLTAAGWAVQDVKAINLHAQRGVAVREFPTATGPADYMLFADGKAIGIVEAKKVGETLSAVHTQAARYGSSDAKHIQRWAEPLPFTYETTGVETFFTDEHDPTPRARRVFCFHRPEELIARVKESNTLRTRLKSFPELITAPLRDCQIDAVSSLEKSLSENRPRPSTKTPTNAPATKSPPPKPLPFTLHHSLLLPRPHHQSIRRRTGAALPHRPPRPCHSARQRQTPARGARRRPKRHRLRPPRPYPQSLGGILRPPPNHNPNLPP